MKYLIISLALVCSTNAFATQTLCGVQVEDQNIRQDSQHLGWGFYRLLVKEDGGVMYSCFPEDGAPTIVAVFPNGQVRAMKF